MSVLLPILMGLMMFTMGLTLEKDDFKRIILMPKAIITGFLCQMIFLPLLGFSITQAFDLNDELSIGFLVLCACPGGVLSNYISFSAKGDMALSISLTLVSSVICVFSIPFVINLFQDFLGLERAIVDLPLLETMKTIALLTLLPIILGMLFKMKFPNLGIELSLLLSKICTLLLISYVLYLWYIQKDAILMAFNQVGIPVLLLVTTASCMAWFFGKIAQLKRNQKITLVIETGIQNSALAFTVTVIIMKNQLYSIPTIFYTVAMFLPAIALIMVGKRWNSSPSENKQKSQVTAN